MRKRFVLLVVLLGILVAPTLAHPDTAGAAPTTANDAAARCREFDANGTLDRFGLTRGECVNLGKGLASEEARNYYAGLGGYDFYIAYFGSKGACLAHFRSVSNPCPPALLRVMGHRGPRGQREGTHEPRSCSIAARADSRGPRYDSPCG